MHIFLAFIVRWQNVFHPDAAILVDCLFMFGHKILSCLFMMSVYCYQLKCFQHCFDVPFTCYVSISEPLVTSWTDCEGWSKYIDLTWHWNESQLADPGEEILLPLLSGTNTPTFQPRVWHSTAELVLAEWSGDMRSIQYNMKQCNATSLRYGEIPLCLRLL